MRASCLLWKSTASSNRWLQRQANDPFVKARAKSPSTSTTHTPSYRSRSSFKLLSMCNKHPFLLAPRPEFDGDKIVVDLGAAPGGWSQVAAHKLAEKGRVFALDILDFPPVPDVHSLRGDFLDINVQNQLGKAISDFRPAQFGLSGGYESEVDDEFKRRGMVDVVLSDMMAPMSGVRLRDIAASLDLVRAASEFAFKVLREGKQEEGWLQRGKLRYPGGHLLVKFFQHPDLDEFKRDVLSPRFHKITVEKPPESRKESSEAYWLCQGYKGEPDSQ